MAKIHSRAQAGVDAPTVTVEVHQSNGLPALNIVGLAEAAVRESKDRVRSALINSRFDFPARKLTPWHPQTCRRKVGASICPSLSASW